MILKVSNLHKNFGGIKALNGCSFEIKKGKITAVIGPNGSGKSTMFDFISALTEKDSGRVYFDSRDISKLKDFEIAILGISRTFQDVKLFKNLSIKEHFDIVFDVGSENLLKSLFKSGRDNVSKIKEILNLVGLDKQLNTYATDLSYGQRKLLDLAVAIAKPHSLLMLDEPVAGVNPALREKIKVILRKLNEEGETVLLIEHDMNFVMDLADYVVVLDEGKVLAEGKPKQIQNNRKVLEAYLGE